MSDVVGVTRQEEGVLAASLAAMALLDEERHVAVNQQFADLFGFEDRADVEGSAWRERFDEETRSRLECEIVPICHETGQWRGVVTGRRRDGSGLELELSIRCVERGLYAACVRELVPDRRLSEETGHREFDVEAPPGADATDRQGIDPGRGSIDPGRGSIGPGRDADREDHWHRRDGLGTLDRITQLVLEITRDVFDSAARREIEKTACEGLAASDLYRFAWTGQPDADGDGVVPQVAAGIDVDDLQRALAAPGDDADPGPAVRAVRTGEAVVSRDVLSDPEFEAWRPVVTDHDVRSAAVVPLVSGDTAYGYLAVAATRPPVCGPRELERLVTLGRAVAFAVDATENRKLLYSDTVVELEFEVTDPGLVFVLASDRLDCELTVTGCVESAAGTWSVYVSVDGAPPVAVREAALEDPRVEAVRVIVDGDDDGLLELEMAGGAPAEFAASGAILTSGRAVDGKGRFCIEVPQTTDVRRLTDRLQAAYPESTLVARREFERPARTAKEVRQSLVARLTDRQREALERATLAGYFDWPRSSTAGDVADSMAVSETTFHYHLRNGLDTLLGTLTDLDVR